MVIFTSPAHCGEVFLVSDILLEKCFEHLVFINISHSID